MILTIAGKELKSLFSSPLAWTVLAVLQLTLAWIFFGRMDAYLQMQPRFFQLATPPGVTEVIVAPLVGTATVLLMMAVPLLAMRLIAEERRNGTMTFLVSAPVSMTQIVLGKFLGLTLFLAVSIGLLLATALSLYAGGILDLGLLAANFLGLLLIAASFAALGLYFSCLTTHPAVAAIGSLGALLALWLVDIAAADPESLLHSLSILRRFENFNRGLIDTFDCAYFALFIIAFLVLAIRRLDGARVRG